MADLRGSDQDLFNPTFEAVMRGHLPYLGPDEEIAPDLRLREVGLDSLGMVALLVELEQAFDLQFRDDVLDVEIFTTAGSLWKALSALLDSSGARSDATVNGVDDHGLHGRPAR
jgi:acyl carrier protein